MKTQVLLIILLLFTSLSCVTATDLDNSLNESNNLANTNNHVINLNHNTHLKSIIKDLNEIYNKCAGSFPKRCARGVIERSSEI